MHSVRPMNEASATMDQTQALVRTLADRLRATLRAWDALRAHLVHTGDTVPANLLQARLGAVLHRRLEELALWDEAITASDPKNISRDACWLSGDGP